MKNNKMTLHLVADVTDTLKYCYNEYKCSGGKDSLGTTVMTREDCCENGGRSWGIAATDDCVKCNEQPKPAGTGFLFMNTSHITNVIDTCITYINLRAQIC